MEEHGGHQVPAQAPPPQKAIPRFVSLPSKYDLLEHPIYPQGASSVSTAEAEFEKYKNGVLSSPDTDLVAFWSVSTLFFFFRSPLNDCLQ